MNIREQAFKAIVGNPKLWQQWNGTPIWLNTHQRQQSDMPGVI